MKNILSGTSKLQKINHLNKQIFETSFAYRKLH